MEVDDNGPAGDVSGTVDAKSQPMAVDVPDHVANPDSVPSTAATPQPQPPTTQTVVGVTTSRHEMQEGRASEVDTLGDAVDSESFDTPAFLQFQTPRPTPIDVDVVGDNTGNSVNAGNVGYGSANSGNSDVLMDDATATTNSATAGLPYYASVQLAVTDVGSQYLQRCNFVRQCQCKFQWSSDVSLLRSCGRGVTCCLFVWLTLRLARW
jgi:hypothetical protein